MKVFVKTLKGNKFEINVEPEDTVADVKKNIETVQGTDVYPAARQVLIKEGEVLKDMTTLEENKVAENSFIVIMLRKAKLSLSRSSTKSTLPSSPAQPSGSSRPPQPEQVLDQAIASTAAILPSALESPPLVAPTHPPGPSPASVPVSLETEVYGQAASNLVAGSILEGTIQQIIDMGGGSWDRDTVMRALSAAYNNPERAVEYLYLNIPEQPEVAPVVQAPAGEQISNSQIPAARTTLRSSGPNANPLDLFPQGVPNLGSNASAGNLDFLRNSQQFQALRAMVQANPQILQPILQELAKQNPQLLRHIEEHHADFLRLINEPVEGEENSMGELTGSVPQAVTFTPEEREAIGRLEAMGFDRDLVLEAFFACNKNEELAANYLLDHMHEFDD